MQKRKLTRQEYDWFCSKQEQKVKAVSKEVRGRIKTSIWRGQLRKGLSGDIKIENMIVSTGLDTITCKEIIESES